MPVHSVINAKTVPVIKDILTWTAPAVLVPALRYRLDAPQQRRELFLRDASTYGVGGILFLAAAFLGKRVLGGLQAFKNPAARDMASFVMALGLNILYAGIGAVWLSKSYAGRRQHLPESRLKTPPGAPTSLLRPASFKTMKELQYLA